MKTLLRWFALAPLGAALALVVRAAEPPAPDAETGYVPCKFHQTVRAEFPLRLLNEGVVRGRVQLMLEVDATGRLGDVLPVSYTQRYFADEMLRVLRQWRFEPGRVNREPVTSVITLTVDFEVNGVVAYERRVPVFTTEETYGNIDGYRPHGLSTLDRRPAVLQAPGPVYPRTWIAEGRTGSVIVGFFIDETGQARLPFVDSDADPLLAAAAVAAVKQWRFSPPTVHGKPVLARAEQLFVFRSEGRRDT